MIESCGVRSRVIPVVGDQAFTGVMTDADLDLRGDETRAATSRRRRSTTLDHPRRRQARLVRPNVDRSGRVVL